MQKYLLTSMLLWGCGTNDDAWDIDLAAECAAEWPTDTCLDGCADETEALWAEGYLEHLADQWGLSRAQVDRHVAVRAVSLEGIPSQYATLQVQLEVDWAVSVYEVRADLPAPPTTVDEARAAYGNAWVPQIDVTTSPRPWSEVEAFVADCEAEHGVTFPDWCDTYLTFDADDDDQAGLRFNLRSDLAGGNYIMASVYAWGDEPDTCRENQVTED